jgi:uncharacterized iron-regulated protein
MKTILSISLLAAALGGCAGGSTTGSHSEGQPASAPPTAIVPDSMKSTKVFTSDGRAVAWDDVVRRAVGADVVIIAEQHGHPAGLSAAAALWRSTLEQKNACPALALEFFERDDQSRIDDYLAGLSTEETFLKRTGKTTPPGTNPWDGGYPPGHRDMVEAAKAAHAPVIAANAPRPYVRLARTGGYAALAKLTPEQQRLFVLPRFAVDGAAPDNRYWHDFLSFMGGSPEKYAKADAAEREKTDSMFRSQSIWDATMADSVRHALARGYAPVVLVVGQFHADFANGGGGGTVQALKAVRPETKLVVISFQDVDPTSPFRAEDKGRADFIVYTGPRTSMSGSEPGSPPPKH